MFDYMMEVSDEDRLLPLDIDTIPPGPELAALLSSVEVSSLTGYEQVLWLRGQARLISHHQAQLYQAMTAILESLSSPDDEDPFDPWQAAASEIRAALRLTRRSAEIEIGLANHLSERCPQVWEALFRGTLDLRRVRVLIGETCHLPEEIAQLVLSKVMAQASNLTTGQLRALVRKLALAIDPESAKERYEQALSERRVIAEATDFGTGNLLGLDLPPDRVETVMRKIAAIAEGLRGGGEERSLDQLRADVFLDLLEGKQTAGGRRGGVELRVDLTTLTGLSESPGELSGMGPVIADIARQVAERQTASRWTFVVTDPETGMPVAEGITRRRPHTGQRRAVLARYSTCIFPGCIVPATDCDLDHRLPWAKGGETREENLGPLCRHDHMLRHHAGWSYRPLPGGDVLWRSPLGHEYTSSGRSP
ncbi:MAG: DUF222 domain-containing protein [Acidimicrobiia bacterium]